MANFRLHVPFDARQAIVWTTIPASERAAVEGETFELELSSYIDGAVSYSIISQGGTPSVTASVNSTSGLLSFDAPSLSQQFTHTITVRATDSEGGTANVVIPVTIFNYPEPLFPPSASERRGIEGTTLVIDMDPVFDFGITTFQEGVGFPNWASFNNDSVLTMNLPEVDVTTTGEIFTTTTRTIFGRELSTNLRLDITVIDQITASEGIDAVRGIPDSFDASEFLTGTRTNWGVGPGAPSGIDVNDAGTVFVNLDHYDDTEPENIQITTNQGNLLIPFTQREMFPDDFVIPINVFWSAWRSYDRSARDLWIGTYQYRDADGVTQTQEVTVSSAADGYLDLDALETTLAAIDSDGILFVTMILEQVGLIAGYDLPASNLSDDNKFLAVHMQNGAISDQTVRVNGNLMFQSGWRASDFHPDWSNTLRRAEYLHNVQPSALFESWALYTVQKRNSTSSSSSARDLKVGDNNSYNAGIRSNSSTSFRFNISTPRPDDISISVANQANLFALLGSVRRRSGTSSFDRTLAFYRLSGQLELIDTVQSNNNLNSGGGAEIDLGDFDWAEMAFYDLPHTDAGAEDWNDEFLNLMDNLVAQLAGNTFDYD